MDPLLYPTHPKPPSPPFHARPWRLSTTTSPSPRRRHRRCAAAIAPRCARLPSLIPSTLHALADIGGASESLALCHHGPRKRLPHAAGSSTGPRPRHPKGAASSAHYASARTPPFECLRPWLARACMWHLRTAPARAPPGGQPALITNLGVDNAVRHHASDDPATLHSIVVRTRPHSRSSIAAKAHRRSSPPLPRSMRRSPPLRPCPGRPSQPTSSPMSVTGHAPPQAELAPSSSSPSPLLKRHLAAKPSPSPPRRPSHCKIATITGTRPRTLSDRHDGRQWRRRRSAPMSPSTVKEYGSGGSDPTRMARCPMPRCVPRTPSRPFGYDEKEKTEPPPFAYKRRPRMPHSRVFARGESQLAGSPPSRRLPSPSTSRTGRLYYCHIGGRTHRGHAYRRTRRRRTRTRRTARRTRTLGAEGLTRRTLSTDLTDVT